MCRMLGIASQDKAPEWLEDFRRLSLAGKAAPAESEDHIDGWGIAGYLGKWTTCFGRSGKGADIEAAAYRQAVEKALLSHSRILIAHMREASEGSPRAVDAHPFIHYDWIFCHNGTVKDSEKLIIPRYRYEGTTGSERLFKHVIDKLYRRTVKDFPGLIRRAVDEVRHLCACTSLTFLLSSGGHLIGYRDSSGEGDYDTLYYADEPKGFLFCSAPLPGHGWKAMKNGELIMVDKYGGRAEGI